MENLPPKNELLPQKQSDFGDNNPFQAVQTHQIESVFGGRTTFEDLQY